MGKTYKIAILPGDGTGPEVVREGIKVLDALSKKNNFKYESVSYDHGGERYLKTKELVPDSVLKELSSVDAIFLGAIGHPGVKPGILEKGILLKLRFYFDQYINLRPVKLYEGVDTPLKDKGPSDIDFVVVREKAMSVQTIAREEEVVPDDKSSSSKVDDDTHVPEWAEDMKHTVKRLAGEKQAKRDKQPGLDL